MTIALAIALVGILVFLAHLLNALFNRTKVPDVLILFIIGIIIGPILNIVTVAQFGVIGPVFATITLVVILFESGTNLSFSKLGKSIHWAMLLTVVNFLATAGIAGSVIWIFLRLGLYESFIIGAIVGGTSSIIVIPLVRQLKMDAESKTILILESALSDVLCIVVALGMMEGYKSKEIHILSVLLHILLTFGIAIAIGAITGGIWSFLIGKVRNLQNSLFTTLAFVFVIFGATEIVGYSGAIAALAFGITLANLNALKALEKNGRNPFTIYSISETERSFFSEIVFLLKTFFFIYIGICVRIMDLTTVLFGLLISVIIFIIRIPVIRISISKKTPLQDATLMSVIVPKGLAAAVLASLPLQQGFEHGEIIQNLVYTILLFTILFTSIFVFLVEKTSLAGFYGRLLSRFSSQPPKETDESL
jgi:cell volume regulation protein A